MIGLGFACHFDLVKIEQNSQEFTKYESIPYLREFNDNQHEPTMKMCEFWQGKDEPIAIKTNRRDDQSTN
jgi:hypothetical protein